MMSNNHEFGDNDDLFDDFSDEDQELDSQTPRPLSYNNLKANAYPNDSFYYYDNANGKENQESLRYQAYHGFTSPPLMKAASSSHSQGFSLNSNSSYNTMVDNDFDDAFEKYNYGNPDYYTATPPPRRKKTVAFRDSDPGFPETAYSPTKTQFMTEMTQLDSSGYMRPYSQVFDYSGEDYLINPLEDADDDSDIDPFGDDDSLFLETGEEITRKGTKIRRQGTMSRKDTILKSLSFNDNDDENFKPTLSYTKTIKKAKLVNGNYVIDAPVPEVLLDMYGNKHNDKGREMTFMRYTACTCGPSNFMKYNYSLRQALYNPPRTTEILICITMYNEDEILLARTLKGVFDNIKNLTNRSDPTWGEESWKKIVVCIISDGRVALNARTQKLLTAMGIFQDGYAKSKINDKSVKAHLYEYTTTVGIEKINDKIHFNTNNIPVQMMFCLKEKNTRKINSHRWCFQAFSPILNPKVVMLLDCGTKPSKDAIFHLWRSFKDPNVAGACGEIQASLGPRKGLLKNPMVAAQNFEYKISNILDKPMESVFGFISVLPGAFSAYRYDALLNIDGVGPLEKYFKGEFLHHDNQAVIDEEDDEKELKEKNHQEVSIFTSNMYLAEDRILCFELVAKRNHNYILRYVNDAKAETDVPENIDEFVMQRRRWLNGSLFAAAYSVFHWTKIWKSNHSLLRKMFLQLEFYYQLVTLLVSWFSLSSFFLVFKILTTNLGSTDMHFNVGKYLAVIFEWFYIASVICTFVLAFGNTPRGTKKFYTVITCIFAVLMVYMLFSAIFLAVHTVQSVINDNKGHFEVVMLFSNSRFRDLVVSVVSTYTLYFIGAFMFGEPSFMFTSFAQYVLLSPTYINILNIYAFCNIHDVSWGTKGIQAAKDLGAAKSIGKTDELVMIVPGVTEELNESYQNTLEALRVDPEPVVEVQLTKRDDSYYAFVRTITVLIWMLTNAILIIVVLECGGLTVFTNGYELNSDGSIGGNAATFLTIILWIVAGLAIFRFFGSLFYLIFKSFRPLKWRIKQRKARRSVQ